MLSTMVPDWLLIITIYPGLLDLPVSKSQTIGYVGSTGNSTGNHLDFKIYYKGSYYNPELYVVYGNGKPPQSIHSLIG
mgnify:CR=1 FL=1